MKQVLALLTGLLLITGCASDAERAAYYATITQQAKVHAESDKAQEIAYIQAITALKDNPMAILALALTHDEDETVVDYSGIYQPESFSSIMKAVTPVISTGLAWGFGAWGVGQIVNGIGSKYNVSGDARVAVESDLDDSQTGYSITDVDPEDPIPGLQECLTNPPGGLSPSGTPMYSNGLPCTTYFQ